MQTVIYGTGSVARMSASLLGKQVAGVVGFGADVVYNYAVTPDENMIKEFPPNRFKVLIAIGYQHGDGGMNSKRVQLWELLTKTGYKFARVYPQVVGDFVVGDGSLVLQNVTFHDNSDVGRNCFISSGTVLGHDVVIHDHSWINANVSLDGGAVIGERCVIGAGAVIGAGVTLGDRTLVGPGAVVLRDTEPDSVWLAPAAEKHRFNSVVFGRMQA